MGYLTKVQVVERANGQRQFYLICPVPLAQALEMEKGESIEWVVENKGILRITRSEARRASRSSDAQAAKKWFIDGFHEEKDEMNGRIVFLAPDMKTELGDIELQNLGFKKFSTDDYEANSEKIARFHVELYCEGMKFNINYADPGK